MTTIHPRPIVPRWHQISRGMGMGHVRAKALPAKGLTRLTFKLRFMVSDKTPLLSGIQRVLATSMPVSHRRPPMMRFAGILPPPGQSGPPMKCGLPLLILSRNAPLSGAGTVTKDDAPADGFPSWIGPRRPPLSRATTASARPRGHCPPSGWDAARRE